VKRWLVDTNVLSEARKRSPDRRVADWLREQPLRSLYVSEVTLAELRHGILRQPNPTLRDELEFWFEGTVRPLFDDRTIEVTEGVLLEWLTMGAALQASGRTVPSPDLLIAATARRGRFFVATRDVKHFLECDVPVLNPWTGEMFNVR